MPPPILPEDNQATTTPHHRNPPPLRLLHNCNTINNNDNNHSSSSASMIISSCSSPPIRLQFMDLSYTITLPNPTTTNRLIATVLNSPPPSPTSTKTIIKNISGAAFPGEILAVLGPSRSGKSTLLNLLSAWLNPLSGTILANNHPINRSSFIRQIGFVSQDVVLYTHLTVRETLVFASLLRLPHTLSKSDKIKAADSVIADLSLTKCQNTIIGNNFIRGVSGGERKRVSIGHEMLMNPSLLILDEPTSGLDSTAAMRLVEILRVAAERGRRTVVASMHQPSSRLFQMVDKVLVLSEGESLYFGNAKEAMAYFESVGFEPAFPVNPADFLLDLANG